MRIGDEAFVHGYIDEIRNDTVIIRNNGGYFGTAPSEIICGELPEQRKGEWKRMTADGIYWFECSECGTRPLLNRWHKGDELSLYCPNCGCEMEGW